MYAPYRIPPFDHTSSRSFEEKISLNCAQIMSLAPNVLILRFEGVSDGDLKYTLKFTGDFAAKEEDESLTVFRDSLFEQKLVIANKTFEFPSPALIKGAFYQITGERTMHPLAPQERLEFLDVVYVLESFDGVDENELEGVYKRV